MGPGAHWSMTPGLATLGALLMILSMAIDLFAQQIESGFQFVPKLEISIHSFPFLQVDG